MSRIGLLVLVLSCISCATAKPRDRVECKGFRPDEARWDVDCYTDKERTVTPNEG